MIYSNMLSSVLERKIGIKNEMEMMCHSFRHDQEIAENLSLLWKWSDKKDGE